MALSVVSVILVCVIILVIAWLFSRLLGKTWAHAQKGRYLDIIDQAPLGQDRALLIVRIQDNYYLVGSTPQNIQLVAELGDDVYIYLVSSIGTVVYHSSNASRVSDITETGFTLTNGGSGTGVGIPYRVKSGEVITLSMTKNANCQIFAAYYDANGFFHSIVSLGNVGNHLTVSDTAPIDGWVVIQFCPYNANQVVNFSNLSLSIA